MVRLYFVRYFFEVFSLSTAHHPNIHRPLQLIHKYLVILSLLVVLGLRYGALKYWAYQVY